MSTIRVPLTRKQLSRLVDEYELDETYCDIDQVFDDVKVLDSDTASITTQAIVKIKPIEANKVLRSYATRLRNKKQPPNVFLKFMPFNSVSMNRPTIEIAIYKYLYKVLVQTKTTPHIMKYIASAHCKNLKNHLDWLPDVDDTVARWYEDDMDADGMDTEEIIDTVMTDSKLLVVEMGRGMSLLNLLEKTQLFLEDVQAILFQIGYTLRQMHLAGVRHNDLHIGNVWVNMSSSPTIRYYQLYDGRYAKVESIYTIKIYDFDTSAFTNDVLSNQYLEYGKCSDYGICQLPDPLFDWVTLCYSLYTYTHFRNQPLIRKIVRQIVIDKELLTNYRKHPYYIFEGRYCEKTAIGCHPEGVVPQGIIHSFEDLWASGSLDKMAITDKTLLDQLKKDQHQVYRDLALTD